MTTKHHGISGTPEYLAFMNAKARCLNPNDPHWKNYGGRGIEVRLTGIQQMIDAIGRKPAPHLTLDRKNNDGHYEVGNLHWATRKQQNANQRPRMSPWEDAVLDRMPTRQK